MGLAYEKPTFSYLSIIYLFCGKMSQTLKWDWPTRRRPLDTFLLFIYLWEEVTNLEMGLAHEKPTFSYHSIFHLFCGKKSQTLKWNWPTGSRPLINFT